MTRYQPFECPICGKELENNLPQHMRSSECEEPPRGINLGGDGKLDGGGDR